MFEATHEVISQGLAAYPHRRREQWVLEWPGMVVLVACGIFWTREGEKAIGGNKVEEFEQRCTDDLMKVWT